MQPLWNKTPWLFKSAIVLVFCFALFPLINLIVLAFTQLQFNQSILDGAALGQMGDFFGGHTAAFSGSLSLAVVLFFSYHQSKEQAANFKIEREEQALNIGIERKNALFYANRTFLLDGINLITQWDLQESGCAQAMRLLDYYCRWLLKDQPQQPDANTQELLLLLNTVITKEIRKNLQGKNGTFNRTNYPFACQAVEKIRVIREAEGKAAKANQT